MLGNPQYATGPGPGCHHGHAADPSEPAMARGRGIATTLRLAIEACREALVACHEYEQLRARGVPHEAALRHAAGVGLASPQRHCRAAHPLYFAGRV